MEIGLGKLRQDGENRHPHGRGPQTRATTKGGTVMTAAASHDGRAVIERPVERHQTVMPRRNTASLAGTSAGGRDSAGSAVTGELHMAHHCAGLAAAERGYGLQALNGAVSVLQPPARYHGDGDVPIRCD